MCILHCKTAIKRIFTILYEIHRVDDIMRTGRFSAIPMILNKNKVSHAQAEFTSSLTYLLYGPQGQRNNVTTYDKEGCYLAYMTSKHGAYKITVSFKQRASSKSEESCLLSCNIFHEDRCWRESVLLKMILVINVLFLPTSSLEISASVHQPP